MTDHVPFLLKAARALLGGEGGRRDPGLSLLAGRDFLLCKRVAAPDGRYNLPERSQTVRTGTCTLNKMIPSEELDIAVIFTCQSQICKNLK